MFNLYNIPQLGKLNLLEVYDYHNEPILFSCHDDKQSIYIALYADNLPDHEMWLFVKVSLEKLNFIRAGAINLHDAFAKPEKKHLLKVLIPHWNKKSANFDSEYVTPNEIDSDILLPTDYCLDFADPLVYPPETPLNESRNLSGREVIGIKFTTSAK